MSDHSGLLDAERIAVVGATDREGSIGRALMENLSEFDGDVVPVNPNRERVLSKECYPEIGTVPDATSIDLAVVVVPASAAVDAVRRAGEVGITNVVVVTAGFSESGPAGERRERELIEVAERYDIDLVGPNCVGVLNTATGLNATFLRDPPTEGTLSLVSQSGAFISAALGWATQLRDGVREGRLSGERGRPRRG